MVGLSYEARNVLSHTRPMMQIFLAYRDSPIIPLRRSPFKKGQQVHLIAARCRRGGGGVP